MASSSSTLRSSNPQTIHCHHGFNAKLRMVRKSSNMRERFYGCPNWPNDDCAFFKWAKECIYPEEQDLQLKLSETEKMMKELGEMKKKTEYKMDKVLLKKQQYKDEINNLQLELKKAAAREKNLFFILFFSWAVLVMYIALSKM